MCFSAFERGACLIENGTGGFFNLAKYSTVEKKEEIEYCYKVLWNELFSFSRKGHLSRLLVCCKRTHLVWGGGRGVIKDTTYLMNTTNKMLLALKF